MKIHSFAPVANSKCRILILGSMPGKVSLRAGEYYAHPRNLFWRLMEELLGVDAKLPYRRRIAALKRKGIGLWDVLHSCTRSSSLDSDIVESSIVPNDFSAFLRRHPRVDRVCFNGAKAARSFRRHVLSDLPAAAQCTMIRLPSTSPANAGIPWRRKLREWEVALR